MTHVQMSARGARLVAEQIKTKPQSNIVFAWGDSPRMLYRNLVELQLDWSQVKAFTGDDYVGARRVGQEMLESVLYSQTNLPPKSRFNPIDFTDYDSFIKEKGGIDLTILGLGPNGHILFNEPGPAFNTNTHKIQLSESTIAYNQEKYGERLEQACTMGLLSILRSRKIILLVSGEHKKEIARKALFGDITPEIPATVLRKHPFVTVLADFELSEKLHS